jgi:DNA-binding protein Fis
VILSEDLESGPPGSWEAKLVGDLGGTHVYEAVHEAVDRLYLPRVLSECGSASASASASKLGITRDRLRGKLRGLGLRGEE